MTSEYLRRYLDLPALIYVLSNKKLSLLSPERWDDGNDSHYLSIYRERKGFATVLAACFSQVDETYHHWRVFASGASGVCIRFHRGALLAAVKKQSGIRHSEVTYLKQADMRGRKLKVDELPFLKRFAYEHESEFRLLFESKLKKLERVDVDIPLTAIERVTLSPWMNRELYLYTKSLLRTIPGCSRIKILRSTLIGSQEWKEYGENAA